MSSSGINTAYGSISGAGSGAAGALLPVFYSPKTIHADLPQGYRLVLSNLPAVPADSTPLLTTVYDGEKLDKACVLRMDYFGTAVSFSYLGLHPVEERNLSKIVGWHDSFLNAATFSFDQNRVHDWISFFREDWATVLYFDKFVELAKSIRDSLQTDKGTFHIVNRVFETSRGTLDDLAVSTSRRTLIGAHNEGVNELTRTLIESHTLEFLRKHRFLLDRFHIPPLANSKDAAGGGGTGGSAKSVGHPQEK